MANYTTKRKYTKKAVSSKKTVIKKVAPTPVKELSFLEKAVSWVKSFIK